MGGDSVNEDMGLSQMQQTTSKNVQTEALQQVVQMIMQGVTPKQLLDMGVPEEVLAQALQMVDQMGKPQQMEASQEGLAGMYMPKGNV